MEKILNFDMDGTFVDLYGVENWLDDLTNSRTRPYEIAKPLGNIQLLARYMNKAQKLGYLLRVVTKTSRSGNAEYHERIKVAKLNWLAKHLKSVNFDDIIVIPYATEKQTVSEGYLFDDEQGNREKWGDGAYTEKEMIDILKELTKNG